MVLPETDRLVYRPSPRGACRLCPFGDVRAFACVFAAGETVRLIFPNGSCCPSCSLLEVQSLELFAPVCSVGPFDRLRAMRERE